MPELPELQAAAEKLDDQLAGRAITAGHLLDFTALKTYDPPLEALAGLVIEDIRRWGKFIDINASGLHLVFHLARAGWITHHDVVPKSLPRPGKTALALRLELDDGSGLDLTEAGKQRNLSVYLTEDPENVPGIAALGPDALDELTVEELGTILHEAGGAQLKGVLRNQRLIAGIGNAFSDEILHAARLSPFQPATGLSAPAVSELHGQIQRILLEALERLRQEPLHRIKKAKAELMRIHGRAGQACPVCGDTIAQVSFADSSLQYCPHCQTGGRKLADRRLSRLLK